MNQDLYKFYQTKFRDIDLDLELNPLTSDFVKLSHIESVKRRVKTLVLTNLYDRPYQPALGTQVSGLLFENIGTEELSMMEQMIIDLIRAFEPFVDVLRVGVSDFDNGLGVQIQISFSVIDSPEFAQLTIILDRVR